MTNTLRVTGKGKVAVKPDWIQLILELEDSYKTYEETLQQSAQQVGILKDCFKNIGFATSDLRTLSFNIDTQYESYKDKSDNWKRKFVGYKFRHNLKLEFSADNQLLGQVLYALAHCKVKPEFHIRYTVKNPEDAKNQLLAKAVTDSKVKAQILADAAGVKLGAICSMDYSWGEIELLAKPFGDMLDLADYCERSCTESYDIDIEPDDIDISDTVTVVWELV